MDAKPLVSVIIPCYNSPDLQAAVRSVLSQDYPRIQLILVDDASDHFSKPDIEHMIRSFSKSNLEQFAILSNPENKGTVHTINRGISAAAGEIIVTLAGDDCFYDDRVLSDWVAAFGKSGAQVMTAYRAVYDQTLKKELYIAPTEAEVQMIRNLSPEELFERLAEYNFIFGCCTARTAESIRRYGAFDERYCLIEDHPMNLRLLRQGEPICFFERIVVKHRGGGASSPLQYNQVYEQDVDKILQHEVLPFTRYPRRMRRKYRLWKRDQELLRRRAMLLSRNKSALMGIGIQLWYYLHHPWRTLCRLPGWIRKKLKGVRHP